MIELYGSPTPSACTIAIMLEETALNYSVFPAHKYKNDQMEIESFKLTPNNLFPILLDRKGPDDRPFIIFEPGAILLYLAEKSKKLLPEMQTDRFDVLQWLLFESAKIGPTLSHTKHFMYHAPEEVPYAVKRFNNETKRIFSIIEKQLAENDFLAGDYSIADIATFPWVREYERYGLTAGEVPCLSAWVERMMGREAVMKGMDVLEELKET